MLKFLTFTSNHGWLQHAGGIGRLIELRGPWRHQTQPERDILRVARMIIVSRADSYVESVLIIAKDFTSYSRSETMFSRTASLESRSVGSGAGFKDETRPYPGHIL